MKISWYQQIRITVRKLVVLRGFKGMYTLSSMKYNKYDYVMTTIIWIITEPIYAAQDAISQKKTQTNQTNQTKKQTKTNKQKKKKQLSCFVTHNL